MRQPGMDKNLRLQDRVAQQLRSLRRIVRSPKRWGRTVEIEDQHRYTLKKWARQAIQI
jgi:hypothetical protein